MHEIGHESKAYISFHTSTKAELARVDQVVTVISIEVFKTQTENSLSSAVNHVNFPKVSGKIDYNTSSRKSTSSVQAASDTRPISVQCCGPGC